jgi:hypothetical protein
VVNLIELTNAFVSTLRAIPELVQALEGLSESISAYIDLAPTVNSLTKAVYQMKPGSVLVAWQETLLLEGEMAVWDHRHDFFVRASRGGSALALINLIVDGVPVPGDGQRWRYCGVMDGVYPTQVVDITRVPDEEGIDYFIITTETKEIGDA